MRRFSAFISLLLCLSCSPKLLVNKAVVDADADTETVAMQVRESEGIDGQYNFTLTAGKRELGGILVVKRTDPGTVRAVATTYFGMRLFDISYTENGYTVNSCTEFLNKKIITGFIVRELRKQL